MRVKMPKTILNYFWGDDLEELSWEKHKDYITKTILEKGDLEATRWVLKKTNRAYLTRLVREETIDPKSKNFWSIYLS